MEKYNFTWALLSACFKYHFKLPWKLRMSESLPWAQPLVGAIALVWGKKEFFSSFHVEWVRWEKREGEEGRCCTHTSAAQRPLPAASQRECILLYRVSVTQSKTNCRYEYAWWYFTCIYGFCSVCGREAGLDSLVFHQEYSMGLSCTVAFKLWGTEINENPGISKEG